MPHSLTTKSYAKQICFKQKSLIIVKWSDKENASCEFQFLACFPIDQPVWVQELWARPGSDGFERDIGQVAGQENRSSDSVADVFIVETLACVVQVTTMLFQGDDSSQSLDLLLSTLLTIWKKEVSKKAMGECRKSRRCSFKEMDVQDDAKDGLAEQLQCIAGRGALGTEDEQRWFCQ